jgi:hypothetical protein
MSDAAGAYPEVASLTVEQRTVLQAIHDYFHEHGTWPTYGQIRRTIRRDHRGWKTAAIVESIRWDFLMGNQHFRKWYYYEDEVRPLRLTLSGIAACDGSSQDTERLMCLLRWLAQGTDKETRQWTTSAEVAQFLGLAEDDWLSLRRLFLILEGLPRWEVVNISGEGDHWHIWPRENIWHVRDVQTVDDYLKAHEDYEAAHRAWTSGTGPRPPEPLGIYYHVQISLSGQQSREHIWFDLSEEELETQILALYREAHVIVRNGETLRVGSDDEIRIVQTGLSRDRLSWCARDLTRRDSAFAAWELVDLYGADVTGAFIDGATGLSRTRPADLVGQLPTPRVPVLYINRQIVDVIRAKDGQSAFNVTKLLKLIDELNDNYVRKNSYASHGLLRAILDHIPPIFGYTSFREVANNHAWGQTDKRYMRRLADFRDQADDALHRQISTKPDVLDFDDMLASVHVNRLLQECAELLQPH